MSSDQRQPFREPGAEVRERVVYVKVYPAWVRWPARASRWLWSNVSWWSLPAGALLGAGALFVWSYWMRDPVWVGSGIHVVSGIPQAESVTQIGSGNVNVQNGTLWIGWTPLRDWYGPDTNFYAVRPHEVHYCNEGEVVRFHFDETPECLRTSDVRYRPPVDRYDFLPACGANGGPDAVLCDPHKRVAAP